MEKTMKKYLLFTLLSTLLFANVYSQELETTDSYIETCSFDTCSMNPNNLYIKLFSGFNYFDLSNTAHVANDSGYVISGAVGYRLNDRVRVEGEYAYRKNKLNICHYHSSERGSFKSSSVMANLLYDFPHYCVNEKIIIQPYIGGGIGCDFLSNNYRRSKSTYFSWQFIAGLTYNLTAHTDLSLEYRLHKPVTFSSYAYKPPYNNSIGVGFTYKFGV
jgi:opacity protein-like surface antigen